MKLKKYLELIKKYPTLIQFYNRYNIIKEKDEEELNIKVYGYDKVHEILINDIEFEDFIENIADNETYVLITNKQRDYINDIEFASLEETFKKFIDYTPNMYSVELIYSEIDPDGENYVMCSNEKFREL